MDGTIEYPKHNATFDDRAGEAKCAPACINLKTFPVRVQDGDVWIEV
jgi:3-phenylpropionate/trans-cinnamate dioxygenase ferredoxin component